MVVRFEDLVDGRKVRGVLRDVLTFLGEGEGEGDNVEKRIDRAVGGRLVYNPRSNSKLFGPGKSIGVRFSESDVDHLEQSYSDTLRRFGYLQDQGFPAAPIDWRLEENDSDNNNINISNNNNNNNNNNSSGDGDGDGDGNNFIINDGLELRSGDGMQFGRAMTSWRMTHTAGDTKPFELKQSS